MAKFTLENKLVLRASKKRGEVGKARGEHNRGRRRVEGKARRKLEFKVKGKILRIRERLKSKGKKREVVSDRVSLYLSCP